MYLKRYDLSCAEVHKIADIYVHISIHLIMHILHALSNRKVFAFQHLSMARVLIMQSSKRLYLISAALQYPESLREF